MPSEPTLVLLPGLGADERMFEPQRAVVPKLIVPTWPESRPRDTLGTFAERLAPELPKTDALYLGGASFGGMVALELAARLKPKAVLLIGSCRSPTAIPPLARHLRLLAQALPAWAFRPRRWVLPFILPRFGKLSPQQRELFWSMAEAVPAPFLKWGLGAILSWKPTPLAVPVYHLHGSDDRLIPLRRVRPSQVVSGGAHLLTLTHPGEVNTFLLEKVITDAGA